jgi:hypothetical protein
MKIKILLAILFCTPFFIKAQVTVTTQLPNSGILLKDQLWNMVITNNSNDIAELKLQLDVRDVLIGQSVINATAGKIVIGKGMKLITVKDVQPIMYNYVATEFSGNYLPCGSYIISYRLIQETSKGDVLAADEVVKINITPLSPPLLTTPSDKSSIETVYPQFTWMPPTPVQMFNPLVYDITVVEIEEGQSPKEAMEFNKPVYINTNLQNSSEKMPTSFEQLQKGKSYAWQVVAKSGFACAAPTEVWEFKIGQPSAINAIVAQTPFIKMKKDNPDKGIAPNGILKLSYVNETTESTAIVQIIDLSSRKKNIPEFKIKIQAGENLIQYDIKKLIQLQEGKVYEPQIINDRKERWVMQFEFHEYKEQQPANNTSNTQQ